MKAETSNRLTWILIGLAVMAIVIYAVYWFFENFERREYEYREGLSTEARRNPFLAAQRYLNKLEFDAKTVQGRNWITNPPTGNGALMVNHIGPNLLEPQEERLLNWVSRGGQLILIPHRSWVSEDHFTGNRLFERLGIELHIRSPDEESEDLDSEHSWDGFKEDIVDVETEGLKDTLNVIFDAYRSLEDTQNRAEWRLAGEHGVHLLEWSHGKGLITILSDNRFMRNTDLGDHDNAWFLSYLLQNQKQIWFLHDSRVPSLLLLLWQYAFYPILLMLLAVIFWMWHVSIPLGARIFPQVLIRRNLLEHLDAVASFRWRIDRGEKLVEVSQERLIKLWESRHPVLQTMNAEEKVSWISKHSHLDPQEVDQALNQKPVNEQGILQLSISQQKLLQRLRRYSTEK